MPSRCFPLNPQKLALRAAACLPIDTVVWRAFVVPGGGISQIAAVIEPS